jgi:hypothetical protein
MEPPWSHPHQKKFSVSGTVADLSTTNPEIKVSNPATGQLDEGKSAGSFCRQVAAWVPDMFCNFYLVKNDKIANNSTTTKAREKISADFESLKF